MNRQTRERKNQIKSELAALGVTKYGLIKSETRYLHNIIHPGEEIGGVIYGQFKDSSAMLIATKSRVIFLDVKPMAILFDEFTYLAITGVEKDIHTLFATVVLTTNIEDFKFRYVNIACANKFTDYVEKQLRDSNTKNSKTSTVKEINQETESNMPLTSDLPRIGPEIPISTKVTVNGLDFLKESEIAVLSTIDKYGDPHGAVVYYTLVNDYIYILTKSSTRKAHNIMTNGKVSLTIFDEASLKILQLNGVAEIEPNFAVKKQVFELINKTRHYSKGYDLPPVTKIDRESFIVLRITVVNSKFSDFN